MWRLGCLTAIGMLLGARVEVARAGAESAEVTLDYVTKKAEERAHSPFKSPRADLPSILRADKLDYDKYREIRFNRDRALWADRGLPFQIEFFHPGYLYEEPVHIYEASSGYVQPIRFVHDYFDYGKLTIRDQIPVNTGYAGYKVLYALNHPDKMDELGAFLGASYYRLLGKNQRYGASARGLAVDCGEPDRPEEFPIFTDWWLRQPKADDKELRVYALLDSVSCTGAYEFRIRPGDTTVADVDAVVFIREPDKIKDADAQKKPLATIGFAPLTSMFWFGEGTERKFDDYRPEVHDSDGILMRMENGEALWRPLNNASVMRHQRFGAKNIRGFGLLQRDRDFASYQDLFNQYQKVPSIWVEPRGSWGEGDVHLVELSTHYEGLDNIVAFWEPKVKPEPMQPLRFGYTQHWMMDTEKLSPNRAVATRIGPDPRDAKRRQIIIDFTGPKLASLPEGVTPETLASCSYNGTVTETQVFALPTNGMWRALIKLEPHAGNKDPIDIRCALKRGEEILTETWTFHWSPP